MLCETEQTEMCARHTPAGSTSTLSARYYSSGRGPFPVHVFNGRNGVYVLMPQLSTSISVAASRLLMPPAGSAAASDRAADALPSNTQGPASLRGVMGPSLP